MSNSSKTGRISRTPHRSTSKAGDTRQAPTFLADGRLFLGDMLCVANSVQQNHQKKHKHLQKKMKKNTNLKFGNILTPNTLPFFKFQLKLHFCFSSKLQQPEGANKVTCGTCMRLLALVHGKDLKQIEIWGDGKKWMKKWMISEKKYWKQLWYWKNGLLHCTGFFLWPLWIQQEMPRDPEKLTVWPSSSGKPHPRARWWMDLYSFHHRPSLCFFHIIFNIV